MKKTQQDETEDIFTNFETLLVYDYMLLNSKKKKSNSKKHKTNCINSLRRFVSNVTIYSYHFYSTYFSLLGWDGTLLCDDGEVT